MNCKCLEKIDAKLRNQNIKLAGYAFQWPEMEAICYITTAWIDPSKVPRGKKKHPPYMFATYCPFCGKAAK